MDWGYLWVLEDEKPDKDALGVPVEIDDGFFDVFEDFFAFGIEVVEVDKLE